MISTGPMESTASSDIKGFTYDGIENERKGTVNGSIGITFSLQNLLPLTLLTAFNLRYMNHIINRRHRENRKPRLYGRSLDYGLSKKGLKDIISRASKNRNSFSFPNTKRFPLSLYL